LSRSCIRPLAHESAKRKANVLQNQIRLYL